MFRGIINNSGVLYVCLNLPCLAEEKTYFFFSPQGELKEESKIPGNVISSQTGRFVGSGLKGFQSYTKPIKK